MTGISDRRRFHLAKQLIATEQEVAQAVVDDLFSSHPEGLFRDEWRGRQLCTADVCLDIESLAGAIEADSPDAFADYSRWAVRMLEARGSTAPMPRENLARWERLTSDVLQPEERRDLLIFLQSERDASPEPEVRAVESLPDEGLALTKRTFLTAILSGQRKAAINVVEEALKAGSSHVDIYVDVFTDSLHRVGHLWEANRISVAQEHTATAITQYAIAVLYGSLVPYSVKRGNMIVTGVAGEMHQIGANLVADAMEEQGWNVRLLGTNVPHASVVGAVEELSADTLCISATLVASLPSVAELVRVIRAKLGKHAPEIVLGGSAYRLVTRFADQLGARGTFTDLRAVLDSLCP